jgi:uncharacterized membrane protein YqjE
MSRDIDYQPDHEPGSSSKASGQEPGLLESAKLLERELRGVVHDHLLLAALETRQAGESLVRIIAMGVISACLLLTAWLALVSAIVVVLVQHSLMTASTALMLMAGVHCVLAILLVTAIRKRSRSLMFPATISRLKPSKIADSNTEPSHDSAT